MAEPPTTAAVPSGPDPLSRNATPPRAGSDTPLMDSQAQQTTQPPPTTAPGLDTAMDTSVPQLPGYHLLEEIARGGMGAVLRARDLRLDRELAVKVLLDKCRGQPDLINRFNAEAQLLGRLQHPGIVPIHELGRDAQGLPFFAMKLVRGETLAQLLKARSQGAADLLRFLKIFEQVCQAVGYAHHEGVIHRDLKPQNVMVGAFGEVQVMDWGLAKAAKDKGERMKDEEQQHPSASSISHELSSLTAAGAVMGTPAYIAPEQARGEIDRLDARADVFGLGAILCEILTGSPPFTGRSAVDLLLKARNANLEEAFARLDTCGVDSDLVALAKDCLGAEPESRPADGTVVAAAIAQHLTGVQERLQRAEIGRAAAQAKAQEEAQKLQAVRRARRLLAGLAATLLVGTVAAATFASLAEQQRQKAEASEARAIAGEGNAKNAAAAAEEQRQIAVLEKDRFQAVSQFVRLDLLRNSSVKMQMAGKMTGKYDLTVRELLDRAANGIGARFQNQPLVEADIRHTIGATYIEVGHPETAIPHLERAVALLREHQGPDHLDRLDAMNTLGNAYFDADQVEKSLPLLEEVLTATKAKLGPDHFDTLIAMNNMATVYQAAGRVDEALRLFKESLVKSQKALGLDSPDTLIAMNNLAEAYAAAGQVENARPLLEETVSKLTRLLGRDHPDTLACMHNLANLYHEAGVLDKSRALFEETMAKRQAKLGPDDPNTLASMHCLAETYRRAGQLDKAIALNEETAAKQKARLGPDHADTLSTVHNLAVDYQETRQFAKALPLHEVTLARRKARFGADHPDTLNSMNSLASTYVAAGQHDKGVAMLEQTMDTYKRKFGDDHEDTLLAMNNLAHAYQAAGKMEKALPLFDEVLARRKHLLGADNPVTLNTLANAGMAYLAAQQADKGLPLIRDFLAAQKNRFGADDPRFVSSEALIAADLLKYGQYAEAERHLRDCLTIREAKQPDAWTTFSTKSMLGEALLGHKKYADAEPLLLGGYEGMKKREDKIPPQGKARLTEAVARLVKLYDAWGKKDEADRWRTVLNQE